MVKPALAGIACQVHQLFAGIMAVFSLLFLHLLDVGTRVHSGVIGGCSRLSITESMASWQMLSSGVSALGPK